MKFRLALGLVVSTAALAWLGYRYDLRAVGAAFQQANAQWLAASVLCLGLSFVLRALRWRMLFADPPRPSPRNAFAAMMTGYLFNNVLPARAGELVRVYLLARAEAFAKSRVLGTVVLEKALELTIFAVLALVTVAIRPVPDWLRNGAITLLAAGIGAGMTMILAPRAVALGTKLLRPVLDRVPARLASAAVRTLGAFSEGLRGLRHLGALAGILGLTALIWASEVGMLALVAAAFSIQLSAQDSLFVLIVIAAGTLIPAAPGFIGTFEMFGVLAFDFLGQPQETALACVVALHAIQITGSCLLGGLSIAFLRRSAGTFRTGDMLHETVSGGVLIDDHATTPDLPIGHRH